jgi:ribosome-binding protein aMBF1 (putative translation factor)
MDKVKEAQNAIESADINGLQACILRWQAGFDPHSVLRYLDDVEEEQQQEEELEQKRLVELRAREERKTQEKRARNFERAPLQPTTSFAIALKRARTKKGWSQKQLAGLMNRKAAEVARWENPSIGFCPSGPTRNLLNKLLGTTLPH